MLKFHLSLNVANLERSIAFYRILFGVEPAKCHDDYAKFELVEPPVVFSLVPQPSLQGGSLSKIGLRLADAEAVQAVRQRVQNAGLATQCPCGGGDYKFYVADPDLSFWQVYWGDDVGSAPVPVTSGNGRVTTPVAGPVIWEHYITNPLPDRIPHDDGTVDEVRLTGAFNANLGKDQLTELLRESYRVLKAEGKVVVHGLAGDKPVTEQPKLPGLAALVSRVPSCTEPILALRAAGFMGIQFAKLTEKPWFNVNGVELREFKLIALRPAAPSAGTRRLSYRGPFREAKDDAGNVFRRGEGTAIADSVFAVLQKGSAAEQFALPKGQEATCSVTPRS